MSGPPPKRNLPPPRMLGEHMSVVPSKEDILSVFSSHEEMLEWVDAMRVLVKPPRPHQRPGDTSTARKPKRETMLLNHPPIPVPEWWRNFCHIHKSRFTTIYSILTVMWIVSFIVWIVVDVELCGYIASGFAGQRISYLLIDSVEGLQSKKKKHSTEQMATLGELFDGYEDDAEFKGLSNLVDSPAPVGIIHPIVDDFEKEKREWIASWMGWVGDRPGDGRIGKR